MVGALPLISVGHILTCSIALVSWQNKMKEETLGTMCERQQLTRTSVGLPGRAFVDDVDDAFAARGDAGIVHFLETQLGELEQLRLVSPLAGEGEGALDADGVRHIVATVRVDDEGRESEAAGRVARRLAALVVDHVEDSGGYAGAVVQLAVSVLDGGKAAINGAVDLSLLSGEQRVAVDDRSGENGGRLHGEKGSLDGGLHFCGLDLLVKGLRDSLGLG
jgi:hypothetical protein